MSDQKNEQKQVWFAHFLVESRCNECTIDCFVDVSELMPRLQSFDIKLADWEQGCCGKSQCACCSGVIQRVSLISVQKTRLPFVPIGKLGSEIFRRIKCAMEKNAEANESDDKDKKEDGNEQKLSKLDQS